MADRPHDVTDLYLAPVLLTVDARIEELGKLDKDRLAYEVALESDSPELTRQMRAYGSGCTAALTAILVDRPRARRELPPKVIAGVARMRNATSSRKPMIGVRATASIWPSRRGCGGRSETMRHLRLLISDSAAS